MTEDRRQTPSLTIEEIILRGHRASLLWISIVRDPEFESKIRSFPVEKVF